MGFVAAFSRTGEHGALWLVLAATGAALDAPRRARWLRATRTVVVAYAANQLLKVVVRRPRPTRRARIATRTQLSFPSAHATTSFAGARALSALLPAAPLYALATAMAASRVVLGVHHATDVLAGAALGTALGSAAR